MRLRPVWLFALATTAPACFPAYDFGAGGGAGDDGGLDATLSDAPAEGSSPTDAGTDADDSFAPPPPPEPRTILSANGIATQTGNAQQQHLIFAENSGRYWFFYVDGFDPAKIKTRWSTDFATWTDGAALTLPMALGAEGRNFDVAYRNVGGVDLVHVATSLHAPPKRIVYDTRATIAGAAITFGAPVLVHDLDRIENDVDAAYQAEAGSQGGSSCDPDGTGVAIGADGRVVVATAWVAVPGCCYCDSNFATSLAPDLGTGWDAGFAAPLQHFTVNGVTNARQVVPLASGAFLTGWELADNDPPTNVAWATDNAGAWSEDNQPEHAVFPADAAGPLPQAKNDWSFCRIDDQHIHALRRRYDAAGASRVSRVYEHFAFVGTTWTYAGTLSTEDGMDGSGVVLLTNGTGLVAASIASDGAVRYATWSNGTWGAWLPLLGVDAGAVARDYLSGSGCADPHHPALIWTEGNGPSYDVIGVPVLALFR